MSSWCRGHLEPWEMMGNDRITLGVYRRGRSKRPRQDAQIHHEECIKGLKRFGTGRGEERTYYCNSFSKIH